MKAIKPVTVTDTNLLASNVPETESGLSAWSSVTTYAAGQRCFMTTGVHKIYESIANNNLNHNPSTTEGYWIEVSATNRWKMFDQKVGSTTEYTDDIVVKFALADTDYVNAVSILDITGGNEVVVEVLSAADDSVLWTQTYSLLAWDEEVEPDWYWYFYAIASPLDQIVILDIPHYYNSRLQVTVKTAEATLTIGTVAFGTALDVAATRWGVTLGMKSYSEKTTDVYGVTSVLSRGFSRTLTCDGNIENREITRVYNLLTSVRDIPIVWIGIEFAIYGSTIIYGPIIDFKITIPGERRSFVSWEILGLA